MALGPDPGLGYSKGTSTREVTRLEGSRRSDGLVAVAEEVPVAIAYNRRSHAVVMCTPSDLDDLAVGFTVTEGIAPFRDIGAIEMARHSRGIELSVDIPPAAAEALVERQRAMSVRTGCGLCGLEAIEDAVRPLSPLRHRLRVTTAALYRAGNSLDEQQPLNRETHAIHAAGWATAEGELRVVREDIGRHNALDKTLGALLRSGVDPASGFIVVTSRASMELVQKCGACGVELMAAVSRPTGLAARLATDAGMTLVALLRGERANVYAHPDRIAES